MGIGPHFEIIPPESEALKSLAAKRNAQKSEWLPLWVHSADTFGTAMLLLTEWMSPGARRSMRGDLTEEQMMDAVKAASILHDYGKGTILFQTMISEDCPQIRDRLHRSGLFTLDPSYYQMLQKTGFRHAQEGETLLLMQGCPLSFADVIGAHHGKPWEESISLAEELKTPFLWSDSRAIALWGRKEQSKAWQNAQSAYLKWMIQAVGLLSLDELPVLSQDSAMLLTGLIIMADWIASNEAYFPLLPMEQTEPVKIDKRIHQGWEALQLPPAWKASPEKDYEVLSRQQFGFLPNAFQKTMLGCIQDKSEPGLMILEAPMGLGKTEAALLAANLMSQKGMGGIFFGLPTQATANAIFSRIVEWGNHQPAENQISIRLAHGMAELNGDYQALCHGKSIAEVNEDGGADRLTVHEWFRGRKQALLADFVVGTVDQVLMAALKQKHLMLRHLGLCGKAVIIDECHAYDAYMNQYLETALRWLGKYRTPVIMLSATLPEARRGSFVAAYLNMPDTKRTRERIRMMPWYTSRAYPALTWTEQQQVHGAELPYDGPKKTVRIQRIAHQESIESQIEAASLLLKEKLRDGGCAALVLNTVKRAQAFASAMQESFPECHVLLLHSRFILEDRLAREKELLRRMGKSSDGNIRERVIVIGTQVIEQSLDFDADVMISDLCPVDLLLQRLGRLHRHSVHDAVRPETLRCHQCYLLCAGDALDPGAIAVYGEYLLLRTRALMPDQILLPDDIPILVNKVYDDDQPLIDPPEGYEKAKAENNLKISNLKKDASAFCIHKPDHISDFSQLLIGSIQDDDDHAKAQVRAGEKSMDALLLTNLPSGDYAPVPWRRKGEKWNPEVCPDPDDAQKILAQRIGLTPNLIRTWLKTMTWDQLIQILDIPPAWKSSPWLKRSHLLILNENLRTEVGGLVLTYSEKMGLLWQKESEGE